MEKNKEQVSVILTVWKRNNLERQLKAIYEQTANIEQIYVYQNENHIDISYLKDKYNFIHIHSKDKNFKFHGRFTLPLLFETEYTAIFDDDTIPNKRWIEHSTNLVKEKNCIVGANARKYYDSSFDPFVGNNEPLKCDIVGHCWVFKTAWIHYMWREKPPRYDNGEDIHFCATCQIYGNIECYYPSQRVSEPETWGDTQRELGTDKYATWRTFSNHDSTRYALYEYWIERGWNIEK